MCRKRRACVLLFVPPSVPVSGHAGDEDGYERKGLAWPTAHEEQQGRYRRTEYDVCPCNEAAGWIGWLGGNPRDWGGVDWGQRPGPTWPGLSGQTDGRLVGNGGSDVKGRGGVRVQKRNFGGLDSHWTATTRGGSGHEWLDLKKDRSEDVVDGLACWACPSSLPSAGEATRVAAARVRELDSESSVLSTDYGLRSRQCQEGRG